MESERNLGKQMGCINGFFQLLDRYQILSGKRLRSPKSPRTSSSPIVDTTSEEELERSAASSPVIGKAKKVYWSAASPSPERAKSSPLRELRSPPLPKSPILLPVLESKEGGDSSCKFWKEVPRLSLDSRAITDAKGGLHPKEIRTGASIPPTAGGRETFQSDAADESRQHRSPSVVVRLMGLEPFPDSKTFEPESKPELRRSASESRVSRDVFRSRNVNDSSYKQPAKSQSQSAIFNNALRYSDPRNYFPRNAIKADSPKFLTRGSFISPLPLKAPWQRQSFGSGDFFPEASLYTEVESRLKIRGVTEHSKDLQTLKQILEALQLKGLLHSRKPSEQNLLRRRNFVYDESPIVIMKPSRLSASSPLNRRMRNDHPPSNVAHQCPGQRRSYTAGANSPLPSPRCEKNVGSTNMMGQSRSPSPMTKSEGNTGDRRSNSPVKPKSLTVRMNKPMENRRVGLAQPPKLSPGRTRLDPTTKDKLPRTKKTAAGIQKEKITTVVRTEDESSASSISGSSITTSTDSERLQAEEYREGKNLLERCDKLIHCIADMAATDMQPSPVSVLDSSLDKDELPTPSPVTMKYNIDFSDHSSYWPDELEDGTWSPIVSPIRSKCEQISGDSNLIYISDILRATHYFPEGSDVFMLLEKQEYLKGKDVSKLSRLQRKLIYDTVKEILDRNRLLPPWNVSNDAIAKPSLDKVWSEFQRIREQNTAEDMFDTIYCVLKKDLARDAIPGWGSNQVQMSDMILDVERLVFKDLITETIRDLVELESSSTSLSISMKPRRKLAF